MVVINKIWQSFSHSIQGAYERFRVIISHNPRALFLALVMIMSIIGYGVGVFITEAQYRLSSQSLSLIGTVNKNLAKKVVLDKNLAAYRFNAESITPEMTGETDPSKVAALLMSQKQQTGGGGADTKNLYSLDLPLDPSKGTKIYDSNSKTSFKLIPEFSMNEGRNENGRVIYPLDEGGQAIYSVKGNGIKEDIVLAKPRGDALKFEYRLDLPKTLEARLDDGGNLGIYGVDPAISALAGQNLSNDPGRLKDIQINGAKNHLIYLIPAPTIIQSGNQPRSHQAKAMYHLNGSQLSVETSGLEKLTYPISIDPSVVVTSTADFTSGNDEGNISFDTDAISRATAGYGTIGSWGSTANFAGFGGRYDQATVAYNGYAYMLGGRTSGGAVGDVLYSAIASNGALGSWAATTSLPANASYYGNAAVAYNGYMYVLGGTPGSGFSTSVYYAPINANGTIGTWATTTSFLDGVADHTTIAYNGYMYVIGGYYFNGSTTSRNVVQYAPINADGTVGTWGYTTSFSTARSSHTSAVYNGYVYIMGGINNGITYLGDTQYAPINTDGTLGSWTTSTSTFTTARGEHTSVIYRGYVYIMGGRSSSTDYLDSVYCAPINADGSVGTWTATTNMLFLAGHGSVAYNGYIYTIGGYSGTSFYATPYFTQIDTVAPSTFNMSSWSATTSLGLTGGGSSTKKALTRLEHTSVAYNGFLYVIGGRLNAANPLLSVHSAPINADGTVGAWSENTPLPVARYGHTSVIVNGYLYVIGGQDGSNVYVNTAYFASIGADGTIGQWTTTSALSVARANHGMTNYNGYMYVASGFVSSGVYTSAVEYAVINANGTLGAWTSTTVGNAGDDASLIAYNNYLYLITSSTYYAPINANGTIGSWSQILNFPGSTDLRSQAPALLISGHMVLFGGLTSVKLNTTKYTKINADGSISGPASGTSFTTARVSHAVAIYNNRVYLTGGTDATNSYLGDVQYASAAYGPSDSTVGAAAVWQAATPTNLAIYGHASVVYNNYIYMIGGFGGGAYRNEIRYAPINADGTIGTWTTAANSMSLVRFNAAAAVYGGYLYVSGGQQAAGVFANSVEYAKINADGSIGTWTTSGNTFTTARYGHVTVAYNGKLYVVGGGDSANVALGDVKYATINTTDGSIGTWTDAAATTAERDTDGFVYGGRLYILGGVNGTTYSNTVRYATINSDGTLGSWTTSANAFATARSRHATAAVNGYVYLSGGGTSGLFSDLQYAPINADGSIGTWKSSNSRVSVSGSPASFAYQTMVASKGRLYDLGGIDGTNAPQAASYMTSINAPALMATYSRQINLGQLSTLNSITTNGLLPPGQDTVMFRTAGANGVYGAWAPISALSGAPIANVQYVVYRVAFDDSLGTGYSTTTTRSSVTDVTVDYTVIQTGVNPGIRLRHNKYFNNSEVLQPLETQ
jgi:N-acetylneuraminic acid mutarotase